MYRAVSGISELPQGFCHIICVNSNFILRRLRDIFHFNGTQSLRARGTR